MYVHWNRAPSECLPTYNRTYSAEFVDVVEYFDISDNRLSPIVQIVSEFEYLISRNYRYRTHCGQTIESKLNSDPISLTHCLHVDTNKYLK